MFLIPNLIFWTVAVLFMTVSHAHAASIRFDSVPVSAVASTVLGDMYKVGYSLAPEVVQKTEPVSVSVSLPDTFGQPALDLLASLGLSVEKKQGFYAVQLHVDQHPEIQMVDEVYKPVYRSACDLSEYLGIQQNQGQQNQAQQTVQPVQTQAVQGAQIQQVQQTKAVSKTSCSSGLLLLHGESAQVRRWLDLLPKLDQKTAQVFIRAALYEVSTGTGNDSGVSVAISALSGKLGASMPTVSGVPTFSLKTGLLTVDAFFSALDSDSRFKSISSPYLLLSSGQAGTVTVGQEVPTLTSVTTNTTGTTQGVEYKTSGMVFNITPEILDQTIKLTLKQTVSSFAKTQTGVNGSPTLSKREFSTVLGLSPGSALVVGGLNASDEAGTASRYPWLPALFDQKTSSTSKSQLVLVIYADFDVVPQLQEIK